MEKKVVYIFFMFAFTIPTLKIMYIWKGYTSFGDTNDIIKHVSYTEDNEFSFSVFIKGKMSNSHIIYWGFYEKLLIKMVALLQDMSSFFSR